MNDIITNQDPEKFIVQVTYANGPMTTFPITAKSLEDACIEIEHYASSHSIYHDIVGPTGFFINFAHVAGCLVLTEKDYEARIRQARYAQQQQQGGIIQ